MTFVDDVIDDITGQITAIGLSQNGTSEYAGAGYSALAPTYAASAAGVADITATLEFSGVATDSMTHLVLKRTGGAWIYVPLAAPKTFNGDGRLDLTSAEITAALA